MDLNNVGSKKHSPGEVQSFANEPRFQQHSIQELENQPGKTGKKKVQFNFPPSTSEQQAFENTEYNHFGTVRSQKSFFEDYNSSSSTINIVATDVQKIDNNPTCNLRAKIITLIIIVVLIVLAVSIPIGIVFGVIMSPQSSSGNVTVTNNQNSLSTMSTTVVVSSVSIGSQSGAPCTSYTTINDPSRNVANTAVFSTCDTGSLFNASNNGSWIRFVGTGGTTIPVTSPGMNHCGGFLSGWSNDTLPTTVGTVVNGFVCFELISSCQFSISISMVNCGGFYVYLLPSLNVCNARYCTT